MKMSENSSFLIGVPSVGEKDTKRQNQEEQTRYLNMIRK